MASEDEVNDRFGVSGSFGVHNIVSCRGDAAVASRVFACSSLGRSTP